MIHLHVNLVFLSKVLWNDLKAHMIDIGSKDGFQNLRVSMFTDPKSHATNFPKLKGKAKEIKELAQTLSWYWAAHMNPEDWMGKKEWETRMHSREKTSILHLAHGLLVLDGGWGEKRATTNWISSPCVATPQTTSC